ncbi:helix-turn-helix domain-containing protein [Rhizobium sp. AG207R]|uniref:helix-turn-helix domain-containing protein n=1 Tax=Rhizobium sp. AG207R TaxID=2802287 RepID=UPI0022ABCAE0|nr:helix-turn-helix transcriptional regulator [Rhizobium sp. AG207R]
MRASPRRIVVLPDADVHPVDCHVGRQIRLLRIQCNLSQGDLGNRIGISYQRMQKYETGKNRVNASMLYEIARSVQVSPARFFDGLPEPGAKDVHAAAAELDERLAYIATTEGRELIAAMLRLSPGFGTVSS